MVLLPVGWRGHVYYAWGLLVRIVLAAGILIIESAPTELKSKHIQIISLIMIIFSILLASLVLYPENTSHIHDDGPLSSQEVTETGNELQQLPNKNTAVIAFRGKLGKDTGKMRIIQSRILMHARINIEAITPAQSDRIVTNNKSGCDYKMYINNEDLDVTKC